VPGPKITAKELDECALFVQKYVIKKPYFWNDMRKMIQDEFGFRKMKSGCALVTLCQRGNVLKHEYSTKKGAVLYVPDNRAEALKMHKEEIATIPKQWRDWKVREHQKLRKQVKKHLSDVYRDAPTAIVLDQLEIAMPDTGRATIKKCLGEIYGEELTK